MDITRESLQHHHPEKTAVAKVKEFYRRAGVFDTAETSSNDYDHFISETIIEMKPADVAAAPKAKTRYVFPQRREERKSE